MSCDKRHFTFQNLVYWTLYNIFLKLVVIIERTFTNMLFLQSEEPSSSSSSMQTELEEARQSHAHLQSQITHYQTVLADTVCVNNI